MGAYAGTWRGSEDKALGSLAQRRPGARTASVRSLEAAIGAEVTHRLLGVAELLVQAGDVVVRVGEVGREPQRRVIAGQRLVDAALVLERDGAIEMEEGLVGPAPQRLVVERDRLVAAASLAQERAEAAYRKVLSLD